MKHQYIERPDQIENEVLIRQHQETRGGVLEWLTKINGHLIFSKRGQKYELNRDKWTTYANLNEMYSHTYEEMEEAGVAFKLETPVWMDENRN